MSDPAGVTRAVRTYLDHLTVERGLAPNTLSSYRRDLRRYVGFLEAEGIETLAAVSEATVTSFLVRLREGDGDHPPLGASSAARTVVAVRGCRSVGKKDMVRNTGTPHITVDPDTYHVRADGETVTIAPAQRLPLTQLFYIV